LPSRIIRRAVAIATAAGALLGIGAHASAGEPRGGFLSQPLAEVQKDAFFTWFHLAETRRAPIAGGGQKIDFQPTGDKFHDLTRVIVSVNSAMAIERIDLVLKRSFIASPTDGIFASDIAKSFIGGAPPSDNSEKLSSLANEIQYRAKSSRPVFVGPGYSPPALPEPPSGAYEVFIGKRRSYAKKLSHCVFGIENESLEGSDQLRIHFSLR
jgi:hypothetical protein